MQHRLAADGFVVIPAAFTAAECERLAADVHSALIACSDHSTALRRANGAIYGARNLLDLFPPAVELWRTPPLTDFLAATLGPRYGLVRGLYFDKPPDGNWSLPWHQDVTIAVADHSPPSEQFKSRTMKAGVPHVEAPDEILHQMLTLRIHLDAVTPENGPLVVLPGSHVSQSVSPSFRPPVTILAEIGDVLAMRPLLSHSSGASRPGTPLHRRVIHLEFAASTHLPDGYRWRWFFQA